MCHVFQLDVRVYADAVVNHMTGGGNDVLHHRTQRANSCIHWGPKNGTAASPFFTHSWVGFVVYLPFQAH